MANITAETIIKMPLKHKIAAVAGCIVVLAALYVFLLYKPAREDLETKRSELTELQARYAEQKKLLANLPKFRKELEALQLKFEQSLKLLPNTREIPSLLSNISTMAQECGLNIELFQPKPEIRRDFYAEIPVMMHVTGKYHEFGYFCDRISKLPRIVNISNIMLTSAKGKRSKQGRSDPSMLTASFTAVTFKFVKQDTKASGKKKRRKRR